MKKVRILLIFLSLINISCSSNKYEPTDNQIKDFCTKYFNENSKVQAKSLKVLNISDLNNYYINNDVEIFPHSLDNTTFYIVNDSITFTEIKKINYKDNDGYLKIDGKNQKVSHYYVYYTKKSIGFYKDGVVNNFSKPIEINRSFYVIYFNGQMKIFGDDNLMGFSIRESDIPILKQSLLNRK